MTKIDLLREFEDSLITSKVASRVMEAKEFTSPEALKQYLHDHPEADPKKHHVKMLRDYKKPEKPKKPYVPLTHQYPKHKPKTEGESKEAVDKSASGMRDCSIAEYQKAIAKARYPEPRYMPSRRILTKLYMDQGTEVAQMTEISTRGKKPQVSYMCNPDYLQ